MKNRREIVRNQKIALSLILFLIIAVLIFSLLFGSMQAEAAAAQISYKYYTSIRIECGDTLWGIASRYITRDYHSMTQYMEEICSVNRIDEDDIHEGRYLTIPYYSDEYRK